MTMSALQGMYMDLEQTPLDDLTQWLNSVGAGDTAALRRLATETYLELRRLAHAQLRRHEQHTLNTTGLVHEWYLRMAGAGGITLHNRKHFFVLAAKIMRQVTCAYARERVAAKRGGGERAVPIDEVEEAALKDADRFIELGHSLERLAAREPRLALVVELRFFGGLTEDEAAEAMDTSVRSVQRLWAEARTQLLQDVEPVP